MRPSRHRGDATAAPLLNHIARTTAGVGAATIRTITVVGLVLSRRRRSERDVEAGVEVEAGAGVILVAVVAIVGRPPTAGSEKVGAKGEGSEAGRCRA